MAVTTRNLDSTAVRGVQWTTAATVLTAVMQIGYTAVMARLLAPAAFGLVAMAGVVRFGSCFAEMGHALVQRADIDADDVRAMFTALLGLAVARLAWLASLLAVFFLKNAAVVPLVRVQALGFMLVGLGATATSLLRREMRFEAIAKVEVAAYVLGYGGVGITLAWLGAGVWSLVMASLAQQFFAAALSYAVARHSLRFIFQRAPDAKLLLSMTMLFAGVVADAPANLHQEIMLNLEFTMLLGGLFWLLKGYVLAGIAGAIGTGEVVRTFLYMRITHRDINLPYAQLLGIYKPGLLNAAAVGLSLLVMATAVRPLGLPPSAALLVLMATGALVLGGMVLRWPSTELRLMLQQALARLRGLRTLPTAAQLSLARYTDFLDRRPGLLSAFDAFDQPLVP